MIPAGNASEWTGPTGNNTYLLAGSEPALIDAGVGHAPHLRAIEQALHGRQLALLVITHGHPDHVGGLAAIRERWPGIIVRNHPPDVCRDDELIPAGDTILRAVHTPGHSPDHFCFVDESTRDVYCGDLARLGGTVVIPASAGGSLAQYLASLRRIREIRPRRLLPGHGPIVTEPDALIREYLAHREQREREVIEALRAGCTTIEAIADRVYGGLSPTLLRGARDSVHAHLVKLAEEDRAHASGAAWSLGSGIG